MHKIKTLLISSLILNFYCLFGLAQSQEISIKFIGNCGLYMTDGELNIYSDFPYQSGAYNYMEYDSLEIDKIKENSIFLFTHKHKDHYSGKLMRKVLKEKKGKKYGSWNIKALEKLGENNPNFSIKAYKTKHRFTLKHYSYLITWHGKRIFLSGDTESAATIGLIKDIDWAFIPYWILLDSKEKNISLDVINKVIYHLYPNTKFQGKKPEDTTYLDLPGQVITIPLKNHSEAIQED